MKTPKQLYTHTSIYCRYSYIPQICVQYEFIRSQAQQHIFSERNTTQLHFIAAIAYQLYTIVHHINTHTRSFHRAHTVQSKHILFVFSRASSLGSEKYYPLLYPYLYDYP